MRQMPPNSPDTNPPNKTREGLLELPDVAQELLERIAEGKKIIKIRHEGFQDSFAEMYNHPANYHLYSIEIDDGEKVFVVQARISDPINDSMRHHTEVDMAKSEVWTYHYDGQSKVIVNGPNGKSKEIKLDEEKTLASLVAYLNKVVPPKKVLDKEFK